MLAWSKEPNIREALLNAYVELYLTPPDLNPPNKQLGYLYIAKNLIRYVFHMRKNPQNKIISSLSFFFERAILMIPPLSF
jgi:hypothetical protein